MAFVAKVLGVRRSLMFESQAGKMGCRKTLDRTEPSSAQAVVLLFVVVCLCSTTSALRLAPHSSGSYMEGTRGCGSFHRQSMKTTMGENTSLSFSKPTATRGGFLEGVSSLVAASLVIDAGNPSVADAFCGNPYPSWAYYVGFNEVMVPFKFEGYSGEVAARTVGDNKAAKSAKHSPLVVIPGGPGLPHDYLETLEGASKEDRVVVDFDPIGTGLSSAIAEDARKNMPNLFSTRCLSAQVDAVLSHLKMASYHLLGHGSGAAVALERARAVGRSPPRLPGPELETVLSLTLASPLLVGMEVPPDLLRDLQGVYTKGGAGKVPLCLETAVTHASTEIFAGITTELKSGRGAGGKGGGAVGCPTFITYGGQDVMGDQYIEELQQALSQAAGAGSVSVQCFPASGHLPHLDEREEYVEDLQKFVTSVDDAWAGEPGASRKK